MENDVLEERIKNQSEIIIRIEKRVDELSSLTALKGTVEMVVKNFDKHMEWHEEQLRQAHTKNWQLWMVLITVLVTSIAGLIVKLIYG